MLSWLLGLVHILACDQSDKFEFGSRIDRPAQQQIGATEAGAGLLNPASDRSSIGVLAATYECRAIIISWWWWWGWWWATFNFSWWAHLNEAPNEANIRENGSYWRRRRPWDFRRPPSLTALEPEQSLESGLERELTSPLPITAAPTCSSFEATLVVSFGAEQNDRLPIDIASHHQTSLMYPINPILNTLTARSASLSQSTLSWTLFENEEETIIFLPRLLTRATSCQEAPKAMQATKRQKSCSAWLKSAPSNPIDALNFGALATLQNEGQLRGTPAIGSAPLKRARFVRRVAFRPLSGHQKQNPS